MMIKNFSRRSVLQTGLGGVVTASLGGTATTRAATPAPLSDGGPLPSYSSVRWVSTDQSSSWTQRTNASLTTTPVVGHDSDVMVRSKNTYQTIKGFGACFSELGWLALQKTSTIDRQAVFHELFAPGVGANLRICRTPIAASDFASSWYSYDEIPGDFSMAQFSIERDKAALLPFIHSAQKENPELELWASPWSPPAWMKYNKHYATSASLPGWPKNGLEPGQESKEGSNTFVQDPRYFEAYASYFQKYVAAYHLEGVRIFAVMPQNEFNSTAPYPSCCWTPEGLARFVTYLHPKLDPMGVKIYFGTMERSDDGLFTRFLRSLHESGMISGVGVQWAGKGAIAAMHHDHPDLDFIQSEAECGDGKNDWRYCLFVWRLMRHYLTNGISTYDYWNIALEDNAISTWGWKQNSLVTVAASTGKVVFNHEYYLLKHFSHFVMPGAIRVEAISWSGYDNVLAFENPDRSLVLVAHNDTSEPMPINIRVADQMLRADLPPSSFNTFVLTT